MQDMKINTSSMTLPGWEALLKKQAVLAPSPRNTEHSWQEEYMPVGIRVEHGIGACNDMLSLRVFGTNNIVCISQLPEIEQQLDQTITDAGFKASFTIDQDGPSQCLTQSQNETVRAILKLIFLLNDRVVEGTSPIAQDVRKKLSNGAVQDTDPKLTATYAMGPIHFVTMPKSPP
jgi:hypothetical protein